MLHTLNALWNDQNGFVISAELVLVLTIGVLAMIVGLHSVAKSVTQEMNDVANAFGALNQSYFFKGLKKRHHASVSGSGFFDKADECDCSVITQRAPRVKRDAGGRRPESH